MTVMARGFILGMLFGVFMASCAGEDDVPKGIMPIDSMKHVMYDVIAAQELASLTTNFKDTLATKQRTFELYEQAFAVHRITRADFLKSFHYYEANPDKIKILYDSLTAYSDRKRQDLYKKLR